MHRREFLSLPVAAGLLRGAAPLPNVVCILADDFGFGDLACQNPQSRIPTPNLDRLASQGVRFTDAHSPSAVCTPTRYGVVTGRYCWRSRLKRGVLGGYSPALIEPGRATIASLLKSRGYYTAALGKWHLGFGNEPNTDYSRPLHPSPLDHGFDHFFGIPASLDMPPYVFIEDRRPTEPPTGHTPGVKNQPPGVFWREGAMGPHFQFDQVLNTLTRKATGIITEKRKQPFFLYFALTGPHTPWVPRAEFKGRSKAGIYGDFVAEVDWTVGEVMKAIERSGAASNTLLLFTSDNGPERYAYERIPQFGHYSMGRFRGVKRDAWEGGHRVPFLARWPGHIRPGRTCDEPICLTDLTATCAALSGAKVPAGAAEDSYNILPALLGEKLARPIREAIVHHTAKGNFAIRQGDWVYIDAPSGDDSREPEWFRKQHRVVPHNSPAELFNLKQDDGERRNLYAEHPDIAARLKALLEKYKEQGRSAPVAG